MVGRGVPARPRGRDVSVWAVGRRFTEVGSRKSVVGSPSHPKCTRARGKMPPCNSASHNELQIGRGAEGFLGVDGGGDFGHGEGEFRADAASAVRGAAFPGRTRSRKMP